MPELRQNFFTKEWVVMAVGMQRHMASFGDLSGKELIDLGRVVRTILAKLYYGLEDPDFHLTVRTAPAECVGVEVFPLLLERPPTPDKRCRFRTGLGNVHQYRVAPKPQPSSWAA